MNSNTVPMNPVPAIEISDNLMARYLESISILVNFVDEIYTCMDANNCLSRIIFEFTCILLFAKHILLHCQEELCPMSLDNTRANRICNNVYIFPYGN